MGTTASSAELKRRAWRSGRTNAKVHTAASPLRLVMVVVAVVAMSALSACTPTDPPDQIELPAAYEVQSICDPVAKPGTLALASVLRSAYPGTSAGIVRACNVGGRSEHKEGRAIDWGGVSAFNAASRARVDSMLHWLLDTDAEGHQFANARRLGVMYVIWDARIWVAAQSYSGWQPYDCSGVTLCHQDHVHLSLSRAGALKQTSYWTGRTAEAPGQTAAWLIPQDGQVVLPVTMEPGHPYFVVARGVFYTSTLGNRPRPMADAMCATATDYGWTYRGGMISVDGSTAWTPATNTVPGCDLSTHLYSMVVWPTTAHQPVLRIEGVPDLAHAGNPVSVTIRRLD